MAINAITKKLPIGFCKICNDDLVTGDRIKKLSCNELHEFHEDCIDLLLDRFEMLGRTPLCPICRAKVDIDAI